MFHKAREVLAIASSALLFGSQFSAVAEIIHVTGKPYCNAPGNVEIVGETSITCGCEAGFEQIGTFAAPEEDMPNPAMCGLAWGGEGDGTGGAGGGEGGGGPGGGGGDPPPSCTPEELLGKLNGLNTTYNECLLRNIQGVAGTGLVGGFAAGSSWGLRGVGAAAETGGTVIGAMGAGAAIGGVAAAAWGIVVAEVVVLANGTDCDAEYCSSIDSTLNSCGYPNAVSVGAVSELCGP